MATRTRIKICGITDKSDALDIVREGVDALGFIFAAESPRRIEPDDVRDIVRSLPPFVDAVGVFVDEDQSVVDEIIRYCGLTMVQLHGAESPAYCRDISCRVMKSFRIGPHSTAEDLESYSGMVSGYLFDTFHEKKAGGTGISFDWRLVETLGSSGPVVLAGGLTPDNVGQAIRTVKPFAVDFNSGVEAGPGRKDIEKVRLAVAAVRSADIEMKS